LPHRPSRGEFDEIENRGREFTLSGRDAEVVNAIEEEGLTSFSFDGLRRMTGAHPETLSRILDRLEEAGIVVKSPEGYIVAGRSKEALTVHPLGLAGSRVPLLHTLLPYDVDVRSIISDLKGKWFGTLRWIGHSLADDGTTLKWVTEDGRVQIDARFSSGQLNIEAKVSAGSDVSEAVKASHQLMSHVSRVYSRTRGRRILQMHMLGGYLMPASM
jgi:DNA-binding transcriptional ArsR family regulator